MKKFISLTSFLLCLYSTAIAQYVGIGTETPQAMLDINGDVVYRTADLVVIDSFTPALDVNTSKFSLYRISGADSAFTIAGITAGMDGRVITLMNHSGFSMQVNHEDINAAENDRIITGDFQNLILEDMGVVSLQYDSTSFKWIVNSTNLMAPETPWDTSGTNIFFDNYVGIGTDEPMSPLSIETEINEIGFSHMAGIDSITVASSVSELTGSVGTSTDHVFSLNAGGQGKVHVWPDGDVVIGEDSIVGNIMGLNQTRMNMFDSKLTVMTGLNEVGYTHIGGDNQVIVNEEIGGVSASLGTVSDHALRLKTNALGRLHILADGRVTISPNDYLAFGQFTVHTPNLSYGMAHIGGDGQILSSRMGGPNGSATFGTYSPNHFRLICNSEDAINIISPSLNVGIGIDYPSEKLTVQTPAGNFGISHRSEEGIFLATHLGLVSASIGTHSNHNFRLVTNGQSRLSITYDGKVGIGTINPIHLFEVNGTMRSKEVIVETANWPDYVFDNSYQMKSLDELEKFIAENHHLPNIPSAMEVEANGQHLGAMQQKMMEKIEELTLYILALKKEIDALKENK